MTLHRYLARLIALCLLPPLLLALGLAVHQVRDERVDQAHDAEVLARLVATQIDLGMQARIDALRVLAAPPLALPERRADLHAQAQAYARTFDSQVLLVNAQRQVRLHSGLPFGTQELPAAPWREDFQSSTERALARRAPAVSDVYTGPLSGEPMVSLAVPLDAARPGADTAAEQLALVTSVPTRVFAGFLPTAGVPTGWSVWLLDRRQQPMAGLGPVPGDATLAGGPTHPVTLSAAPWTLVVAVPRQATISPLVRSAAGLAVLLVLTMGVAAFAGLGAGRRLTRAIRSLVASPLGPAPMPDIAEVRQVRLMIDETVRDRDRAEAERRANDETLRTRLEKAATDLQVSQARLQGVFDSVSEAIITTDAQQVIVMANPAAARIFRCGLDQMIGTPIERFIPARFRDRHRLDIQRFGTAPVPAVAIGHRPGITGLRADGEEFPVDAAISHVHIDGQQLFTVTLRDVTELRRVQAALESSHDDLQRLLAAQDRVQENERTRIARELHDELQQTLAAIRMDVGAVSDALERNPAGVPQLLAGIDALASAAIVSTRRIVNDLRPRMLEELGLVAALEALATQFSQRTGIGCRVHARGRQVLEGRLSGAIATCLYRVTQEALNNVAKHARARQVRILLISEADGQLRLRIADDGRGMTDEDRRKPGSFGLMGMHERVRAVGGRLSIGRSATGGTAVKVQVPDPSPAEPLSA
jgi:PAS domain S-box-containing protein